jgi:hypothetical protein
MYRDINYIANFFRGGVASAIGTPNAVPQSATTAAVTFDSIQWDRSKPDKSLPNLPCTNLFHPVTPSPPTPQNNNTVSKMAPPRDRQYQNTLEMYFEWIGLLDSQLSYRSLFNDTHWRKQHCPKNSAVLKRMQRMKDICTVIDNNVTITTAMGSDAAKEIAEQLDVLEKKIFNGEEPPHFAWTRYEKAYKQYASNQVT